MEGGEGDGDGETGRTACRRLQGGRHRLRGWQREGRGEGEGEGEPKTGVTTRRSTLSVA